MQPININDYKYELPQERIALYPLEQRDHSKLLVYQQENIRHQHFYELSQFLPEGATLFFNDTKVIPARLLFQKETVEDKGLSRIATGCVPARHEKRRARVF